MDGFRFGKRELAPFGPIAESGKGSEGKASQE
jgi:hypothetical protein